MFKYKTSSMKPALHVNRMFGPDPTLQAAMREVDQARKKLRETPEYKALVQKFKGGSKTAFRRAERNLAKELGFRK